MKNSVTLIVLFTALSFTAMLKAQMITYSGPVDYYLELSKKANGDGEDDGYNWNVSVDEKRIIEGTVYITFMGISGGLSSRNVLFRPTSIQENFNFTGTVNNSGNEEKTSQPCYDNLLRFTHTATPGDSRSYSHTVQSTPVESDRPVIESAGLIVNNNGYTLNITGRMQVNVNTIIYSSQTYACIESQEPPKTTSNSETVIIPIAVVVNREFDNPDYLEGSWVKEDTSGTECNKCLGPVISRMAHGDMNCRWTSRITASWILSKRTKECDANVNRLEGDVKINGAPASEGPAKIGAGDIIETGGHSRFSMRMADNSEIRIGSKSRIVLNDPCNLQNEGKELSTDAKMKILRGKIYGIAAKMVGKGSGFNLITTTAIWGVRGQVKPDMPVIYASTDPGFIPYECYQFNPYYRFSSPQQDDPEKAELIEGYQSLPDDQVAYYLDFEDGIVKDLTALKGSLHIEDEMGLKCMDIPEGTTVNQWQDGTVMTEIMISIQ
ncbi:MAG: FecR domain-containing protein [Bacteroidales bacterium]|nr:FecR domain-containing protein [Bacteroidales bacterium]